MLRYIQEEKRKVFTTSILHTCFFVTRNNYGFLQTNTLNVLLTENVILSRLHFGCKLLRLTAITDWSVLFQFF